MYICFGTLNLAIQSTKTYVNKRRTYNVNKDCKKYLVDSPVDDM